MLALPSPLLLVLLPARACTLSGEGRASDRRWCAHLLPDGASPEAFSPLHGFLVAGPAERKAEAHVAHAALRVALALDVEDAERVAESRVHCHVVLAKQRCAHAVHTRPRGAPRRRMHDRQRRST